MRDLRLAPLLVAAVAPEARSIRADLLWGDPWAHRLALRLLARLRAAVQRTVGRQREGRFPDRMAARVGPPPATPLPAVRATGRIGLGAGRRGPEPGAA